MRCGAHDPAQPAANAPHKDVGGRVGQALLMVPVGDRGAGTVESPETESGLGALGEVAGQRLGDRRQCRIPRPRHQESHCRHAQRYEVRVDSASSASMAAVIRAVSPEVSPIRARGGVGTLSWFVMGHTPPPPTARGISPEK